MKAKQSQLELQNFYILESHVQTVIPEGYGLDMDFLFEPEIDLDFEILDNPQDDEEFALRVMLRNKNAVYTAPGYKFKLVVIGEFFLPDRGHLKPDRHTQYVFYSALPMVISLARAELANITSKGMLGPYWLPSIDLQDLVRKWIKRNVK